MEAPETPSQASLRSATVRGFLVALWGSGCCRLFPMLFAYIAGFGLMLPFLPNLMVDFYASRHAGHTLKCEMYDSMEKPDACIAGSQIVVEWSSLTSFLTNTILLFFLSPLTGTWSDIVGRKPFLMIGQALSLVPKLVLFFYLTSGLSLLYYYPADVVNGCISPLVVTLAYVADALPAQYRAGGFGIVLAVFAAGIAATPLIGSAMGFELAVYVGVALKVLALVYTQLCINESSTAEARDAARRALRAKSTAELAAASQRPGSPGLRARTARLLMRITAVRYTVNGLSIVVRNKEFMKLTVALMISSLVANGIQDVDSQYFITVFNFTGGDFANTFIIFGVGTLVTQVLLMQPLLTYLGEKPCLVVAFAASVAKNVGYSLAPNKAGIYASMCIGTVGVMSFPAVSSIKANAVPDHEQGAVQGALSGVQAFAQGFGPIIFAQLFYLWTQCSMYMPRALPMSGAIVALVPLGLVCWLDLAHLERWKVRSMRREAGSSEPLLPDADESFDVEAPTGHSVMAQEAGVAHKDADVTQGMFVEGEVLHEHVRPPQ